ncbi:hypothetical protein BGZ50_009034, partial [Haplosporangium sp. Z 11]
SPRRVSPIRQNPSSRSSPKDRTPIGPYIRPDSIRTSTTVQIDENPFIAPTGGVLHPGDFCFRRDTAPLSRNEYYLLANFISHLSTASQAVLDWSKAFGDR